MSYRVVLLAVILAILPFSTEGSQGSGTDARAWAEKLAASQIKRLADSLFLDKNPKAKWAYENGVFLMGLESLAARTGDEKYHAYVKSVIDSYLESDGTIKTYNRDDYNLDNIQCGRLLLILYQRTKLEKYRKAASLLMAQLEGQPRTQEGGFWHKKIYPFQMWLDGIYMASPFLAQYARIFDRPAGFDEVANQIVWIENHTRDNRTGLLYHGWDESRQMEWADPKTGCSKSFWGRAMGWYGMGIVDILEVMPEKHPRREAVRQVFQRLMGAVVSYQDRETGLWYQVVDQGKRDRNYLEASASSMFVYAMAKGIRLGYLDKILQTAAMRGYQGLVRTLIKTDPDGSVHLTQICSVAGLGGPQKRNGTFEYYMSEPVVANDLKGVGAFLMASMEVDKLR